MQDQQLKLKQVLQLYRSVVKMLKACASVSFNHALILNCNPRTHFERLEHDLS